MQNYYNNLSQVLKEQLAGIYVNNKLFMLIQKTSSQDQVGKTFMVFNDEQGKEIILDFSQRSVIVL